MGKHTVVDFLVDSRDAQVILHILNSRIGQLCGSDEGFHARFTIDEEDHIRNHGCEQERASEKQCEGLQSERYLAPFGWHVHRGDPDEREHGDQQRCSGRSDTSIENI